MVVKLEPSH